MKQLNTVKNELTNLGFTVYINRNDELVLTSEQGNLDAFEYVNFDYPAGLIPALHTVAKKAGYEWQCEYCGTYKLYPL
jgi:hypothetical protein